VFELCVLLFVIALCCAAEADEPLFGMGRRHYLGEGRLDIKYTTELATPHVDWADPYVSGPIKVFAIPSVMEGRTLVELMQRLTMDVDAVTIDPAWDVNKWTMSFGEAYGARAEQAAEGTVDFSFMYKYLEEDLGSDRRWDVMIMHGILGWGHLPEPVRQAILRRVRDGMGLVIVGPFDGPDGEGLRDLSALIPATDGAAPDPVYPAYRRWESPKGGWSALGEHYITRGVPLETFPADYLGHRKYAPGPEAEVIAAADGDPTIAVRQVGKGRVVAFGYENYGLAPFIRWDAYGEVGDAWWETWYSLFIRAMVWAAGKESPSCLQEVSLDSRLVISQDSAPVQVSARLSGQAPTGAKLDWQVREETGAVVLRGEAPLSGASDGFSVPTSALSGGSYLLDVFLVADGKRVDWAGAPFEVSSPVRLTAVAAAPTVVEEGKPIQVTVELSEPLPAGARVVVELVDNYQRVIARDDAPIFSSDQRVATATLHTDDLLTHIGWARAGLWLGQRMLDRKQVRVDFATPERLRGWDDFEVNIPFYGPQNYYPWMPLLDEQYRKCGVTWLMEPERNFRFTVLARPSGLGIYHYDRKPFDEQMAAYWETGDRKYLQRNPCLHRDWREAARQQMTAAMTPYLKYRPFHYYIYDEPSLTSYTRAFEFCFTPETRAAFRTWLGKQYGSLKALNSEWGATCTRWEQIEPVTADQARENNLIPAWMDFRRFMDITFAEAFAYTQQVVDELDPGALTLIGGTQRPTPFNGTDWWLMSHAFGILEPYSGISEFRSFNPGLPIIQACGYQDAGPEFEEELWRRALQGQKGATVFWNYTMLDPDLALNSQGVAMERAFGALRDEGVARLLLGARRDDSRIAVLYSQPSMYAAWIQDGDVRSGRSEAARRQQRIYSGWQRAVHSLGLQFRSISYEQLAKQGIDRKEFDLLVLPTALAMSDAEVENVRRFIAAGGVVVSDSDAGVCDEHGKQRAAPALTAADGLLVALLPAETDHLASAAASALQEALDRTGIRPCATVAGTSPEVGRFLDGAAEYVAIEDAPAEAHRVDFAREAHVYDVRERRYLGKVDHVESPAGRPRVALYALLPEAVSEVKVKAPRAAARGAEVEYRASVNTTARSCRHVFAVHVYGPDGKLWHMYGANLDARRGTAGGAFRLAWNDPVGEWRVVASDAASGVAGEARFAVE